MHYFTNNLPCLKNDRVYKLFYAKLIHDGVIKMVLKGSVWLKMRLLILFQAAFFEKRKKTTSNQYKNIYKNINIFTLHEKPFL